MGIGVSNREAETTLNQLLSEMDGFEENNDLIVVAATNLIGNLDDALQRPGRFDHKIEIQLPTAPERASIIKIHLKGKKHGLQQMEISKSATELDGFSGAEIENIVNLAALETVRSGKK